MPYQIILLTDTRESQRIKPLGAYLIADILRKNNFTVIVIDYFLTMDFDELENLLKKFIDNNTLFVGYSSSFFYISESSLLDENYRYSKFNFEKINQLIYNINCNTKIVIGGSCSKKIWNYNLKYKDNLKFNYVMHGYSEKMIVDFAVSLRNKQTPKFNNVYNKLYEIDYDYKGDGHPFNKSIHIWHKTDFIRHRESLPLEVARGCIFKCKFCAYPLLGKNPNDLSYYKNEKFLEYELIDNYNKYKTLNYAIVDDTFNERTDKIMMLLKIRDKTKLDLNFAGFNRIELIARKPEQISLLKDLNFTGHYFGVETFHYPTSKIIGKGIKVEEIRETLYKLRSAFNDKISIGLSLILGLPEQSPELFEEDVKWLFESNSGVDSVVFNPLFMTYTTHSESAFFANPEKYGYTILDDGTWISKDWTEKTAVLLAEQYTKKFLESGLQKISAFRSIIISGYHGYNYFDLIKTKLNEFDHLKFEKIFDITLKNYIEKLKKL